MRRLLAGALPLLLLTAAVAGGGKTGPPAAQELSTAEADRLLRQPVQMDAASRRLMDRVTAAYHRLKSLTTVSQDGEVASIARLKRPRLYHVLEKTRQGAHLAGAVRDARRYYEYTEATKTYLERDAALLDRLILPIHVRLFFAAQKPGSVLEDLGGKPTVREYDYHSLGKLKINGKPAEGVRVSIMVRARGGAWHSFRTDRFYDGKSGLLLRIVNGKRVQDVENKPNPSLPESGFRWKPVPGAVKGFGCLEAVAPQPFPTGEQCYGSPSALCPESAGTRYR